jgi:hypothetical protein
MTKSLNLIHRLIAWLNEREAPCASIPSVREWADLPAHHPSN